MRIELPYGSRIVAAELPPSVRFLSMLDVANASAVPDANAAVRDALNNPIGLDEPALNAFGASDSVLIVVSDSFRQTRADVMLPALLDALRAREISERNVSILFSTGVHRSPTPDEQRAILGHAIYDRLRDRLHTHDAESDENVFVGITRRGTPVEVNRRLLDVDRVIVTGAVVLHYFGGFGGGRKSVVPGLASVATIAKNHSLNLHPTDDRLDPDVRIGVLDGNPVAEDMLEAALFVRVDFILNTVLTRDHQIAAVFCGEMDSAHRAACEFARAIYAQPINRRADLVIAASAQTQNFVQTHKALHNAYQAVQPNGRMVLAAPCPEGLGGDRFSKWLALGDRSKVFAALRARSEINGQTALSTLERSRITRFVTELLERDVALLGGEKAPSLQSAIDDAIAALSRSGIQNPTVYVMPHAAHTVPVAG